MNTESNEMKAFKQLIEKREFAGRKVVLIAKVGSENYNLKDNLSDEDYKVYVLPSKEDLYTGGNRFVKSFTGDVDFIVHDIRDLEKQLDKSNINFIEVLFSVELTALTPELEMLVELREEIARMNLPFLFDASFGMMNNKLKTFEKGTKDTALLVGKYGYCTKSFMTAYRGFDFILRYHGNGFTSFLEAVRYNEEERAFLLSMKHGAFSKEEAREMLADLRERVKELEPVFYARPLIEQTRKRVNELLVALVFKDLIGAKKEPVKTNEMMLKERWKKMATQVHKSVNYMDANHYMHLDNAIEQVENLLELPNDTVSYKTAFFYLNKEVLESYVTSANPEEDMFEETYHLLKYYEQGHDGNETFRVYMTEKKKNRKKV